MRALAEFIMRGRVQAGLVVVGSAALPLLFWLSAAAGSLVLLRRGLGDAFGIVALAMLPAAGWWYFGEPRTLLLLLGTLGLAQLLRSSVSWRLVLIGSVPVGLAYALVLGEVFRAPIEALAGELQALMPQVLDGAAPLSADEQAHLRALLVPVLTGLLAALLQIVSLLALVLGRYWQSLLYNPGGFAGEFRALRLPFPWALGLLVGMLLGPNLGAQPVMLTPLCSVPLAFAGVALVHGLVAQGRLGRFWLVGLYVTLLLFMQLVYPLLMVLAIVDSLIDFRARQTPKGDA